jgi:hypothetical protein
MRRKALALFIVVAAIRLSLGAAVTVKTLQDVSGIPGPLAPYVRPGDIIAQNGKFLAIAGGTPRRPVSPKDAVLPNYVLPEAMGCVLAFIPEGRSARAWTVIGTPSLRFQTKAQPLVYSEARLEGKALIARASWSGPDKARLDVQTRYDFLLDDGKIVLTSEIRNSGPAELSGISYSVGANALQTYNFSPYQSRVYPGLNFRVYERPDHVLGWFNPNPVETRDTLLPGRLRPGQSFRVSNTLLTAADLNTMLDRLYGLVRVRSEKAVVEFKNFAGPAEVVIQDVVAGATFFRTFLAKAAPLEVRLPKGTYTVKANVFPAVRELKMTVGDSAEPPRAVFSPTFGKVHVAVKDSRGTPVPAKVTFLGLGSTASPYFESENPVVTGRGWETTKDSVYPPKDGLDVVLPTGTFLVAASRGPEYSLETRVIEILDGRSQNETFTIDRVVDTRGLVSLDSHMHTRNSDGTPSIPERLRSILVEGLDAVVSTDHNYISDYKSELDKLGLADQVAVIFGEEVTARTGSIHFNAYPVVRRPNEPNFGAVSVEDETPKTLFGLSRTAFPGSLVQVNHPRSRGLGYFLFYELDPEKAATAKTPFDLDFDVMEAMNGARLEDANRQSIEDWFHLLNRGYPIRVVGSSDTHQIQGGEPGYSRTYVLYNGPKGRALDVPALMRAVKEGRSFVSNGPIVSARVGKATFGDLVEARKGRLGLMIRVMGAPWLDISEVRVVVNGERKIVIPVTEHPRGAVKFVRRIDLELPADAWIAVEALGAKSLYPEIQQVAGNGRPANAALPYALTNPILVDVDGNGRFDPIWKDKVQIK